MILLISNNPVCKFSLTEFKEFHPQLLTTEAIKRGRGDGIATCLQASGSKIKTNLASSTSGHARQGRWASIRAGLIPVWYSRDF